jgi:hypothetical protein
MKNFKVYTRRGDSYKNCKNPREWDIDKSFLIFDFVNSDLIIPKSEILSIEPF